MVSVKSVAIGVFLITGLVNMVAQPVRGEFFVKGQVLEKVSGIPLEYVNVVVYRLRDSSLVSGMITNEAGEFEIKLERPGRLYLTADFIGYAKKTVENIIVKPGNETFNTGIIELAQADIEIDEVEVVGERPFISYKLDKKIVDVSNNPSASGGTAVDALEHVPSVKTDIEGNLTLRGSSNFTVLIDGRQSMLSGTDALNQIPANAIDKIEIITNPSVKYDPDGTAGIINVLTKKGKLKGHSLIVNTNISSSPAYGADVIYSYRKDKLGFTGSINYRDIKMDFNSYTKYSTEFSDSITGITSDSVKVVDREGLFQFATSSAKGKFEYSITESNKISVGAGIRNFLFSREFESRINDHYSTPGQTYERSTNGFNTNPTSIELLFSDEQIFNDNKKHKLSLDFSWQTNDGKENDFVEVYNSNPLWQEVSLSDTLQKAIIHEYGQRTRAELNYQLPVTENLSLEAGYTLRIDLNTQEYSQFYTDELGGSWLKYNNLDDKSEYKRNINAGWALVKGKAGDLNYSFGIRGEYTDRQVETENDTFRFDYDYMGWYPSAALSKEFEGGHVLQASYSSRIQRPRHHYLNPFPHLDDGNIAYQPNPRLEPEYSSSLELNYQKSWGPSFIAIETFYRDTRNEMDRVFQRRDDDVLVRTIVNQGHEIKSGVEVNVNYMPVKWFSINPAVSIYRTNVEGKDIYAGRTSSSNDWEFNLVSNIILPTKTRLQLSGEYESPNVEVDGKREESYWVAAAARQEFFNRKLSVSLMVRDIFGTRKREGVTYSNNTVIYSKMQRDGTIFTLSLSLKLNQNGENKRGERSRGSGDNGGNMEMDF